MGATAQWACPLQAAAAFSAAEQWRRRVASNFNWKFNWTSLVCSEQQTVFVIICSKHRPVCVAPIAILKARATSNRRCLENTYIRFQDCCLDKSSYAADEEGLDK
eukprot:366021-Chlamydomonas_euryale.AAC.20